MVTSRFLIPLWRFPRKAATDLEKPHSSAATTWSFKAPFTWTYTSYLNLGSTDLKLKGYQNDPYTSPSITYIYIYIYICPYISIFIGTRTPTPYQSLSLNPKPRTSRTSSCRLERFSNSVLATHSIKNDKKNKGLGLRVKVENNNSGKNPINNNQSTNNSSNHEKRGEPDLGNNHVRATVNISQKITGHGLHIKDYFRDYTKL